MTTSNVYLIVTTGFTFRTKKNAIEFYGSEKAFNIALENNLLQLVAIDQDGQIIEE
jgi:hypothetical protein